MAVGDLNGEVNDIYLTPEQRVAKMAGKGATGPVGRAAGQLPDAAARQASFDATNTSAKYLPPVSLLAASPGAAARPTPAASPAPVSLASVGPSASSPAARPAQAASQIPARLEDSYPTGIGDGKSAIYAGVGRNGEASFSNSPSSLNSLTATYASPNIPQQQRFTSLSPTLGQPAAAASVQPARLDQAITQQASPGRAMNSSADIVPGGANASPQLQRQASLADAMRRPASGPEFATLGSAANLGDGIGTFSQSNPGDAALATTRFQRAIDLRNGYKDKDRLENAIARQAQDRNFTVVSDSSRPPSLADIRFQNQRAATTQSLDEAVTGAQGIIEARRSNAATDQQQRQASRLEDALQIASQPNATPEQKAAYASLSDPTGEKAAARQLAQVNIAKATAEAGKFGADARKADAEAANLAGGLDTQIKREELTAKQRANVTAAQDLVRDRKKAVDLIKDAQVLSSEIAGSPDLANITGTVEARIPTFRDSSQDLINKAQRLHSLITAENLRLMSGVLTDRDIIFLGQISSGLNVGENGIKGSEEGTKERLSELSTRLSEGLAQYQVNNPPNDPQAQSSAQPVKVSNVADVEKLPSGATFIAPDGSVRRKP